MDGRLLAARRAARLVAVLMADDQQVIKTVQAARLKLWHEYRANHDGNVPEDECWAEAEALRDVELLLAFRLARLGKLEQALQDMLDDTAVVFEDSRLNYIEVQMSPGTLPGLRALLAEQVA